jgi:hypothetical protein
MTSTTTVFLSGTFLVDFVFFYTRVFLPSNREAVSSRLAFSGEVADLS